MTHVVSLSEKLLRHYEINRANIYKIIVFTKIDSNMPSVFVIG